MCDSQTVFRERADATEPWPDHGKDAGAEAVGVDDRAPAVLGRRQEGDEPVRDRAGDAAWPPAVKALSHIPAVYYLWGSTKGIDRVGYERLHRLPVADATAHSDDAESPGALGPLCAGFGHTFASYHRS